MRRPQVSDLGSPPLRWAHDLFGRSDVLGRQAELCPFCLGSASCRVAGREQARTLQLTPCHGARVESAAKPAPALRRYSTRLYQASVEPEILGVEPEILGVRRRAQAQTAAVTASGGCTLLEALDAMLGSERLVLRMC